MREVRGKARDGSLTMIRLFACLALLGCIMTMRILFPGAADRMREVILPVVEADMDYRGAIAAIGESLAGEVSFLEVLGDITIRAFGIAQGEDMEVQAGAEEAVFMPLPSPAPAVPNPPIEEVIYLPASDLPEPIPEAVPEEPPPVPETPEAVPAFLARQERFSDHAVPTGVSFSYDPLPIYFVTPLRGPITSPFGFRYHPIRGGVRFHFGTDIAAYTGVPFAAFADGRVLEAGYGEGFGLYILLDHGGGIYTRYAHASALYVQAGETVARGAVIGRVGQTGGVTGPHLHFELKVEGAFRNPEFYVRFD